MRFEKGTATAIANPKMIRMLIDLHLIIEQYSAKCYLVQLFLTSKFSAKMCSNLIGYFFSDIKMSDFIDIADEIELLSDAFSDCHVQPSDSDMAQPSDSDMAQPSDSDMASSHSSSRPTSESSSAHETSTDYNTR